MDWFFSIIRIAALEQQGFIERFFEHARDVPLSIQVKNSVYIMYLCKLYANQNAMEDLLKMVDTCGKGKSLYLAEVQKLANLPSLVIKSVFRIYEAKGYGSSSAGIGGHYQYISEV